MNFLQKEQLYTDGRVILNGKPCFKYADLIVCCNTDYYHAIFLKTGNFFTILMNDYKTLPTLEIATLVLKSLLDSEFMMSKKDKPDKKRLQELYDKLNDEEKYYKSGNYIVRIGTDNPPLKSATFSLEPNVLISSIKVFITSMSTKIEAIVNKENREKLIKYDKLFTVYVNEAKTFKELICIEAFQENDEIKIKLVSENEYYLNHSSMQNTTITGNLLWTLQTLDYSTNIDRDKPFEIKYEGHSLNAEKQRFFFVFSINGIKITNDIRFGLITFSTESGIASDRNTTFNRLLSQKSDCYAQVVVIENSLRTAVNIALGMLDKAINLLYMVLLDDSSRSFFGIKEVYNFWDYDIINLNLLVDDLFYVENVFSTQNYAVLSSKKSKSIKSIEIKEQLSALLNNENILEDFFYLEESKKNDDLLQSVFWLNSSKKSTNKKEKIISLYNSVEFLVTGEKGETLSQVLESEYGEEYNKAIADITSAYNDIQNKDLKKRIEGAITSSFEGTSSVKSKLECLVKNLNVSFTDAEWDLFDKLKKNRQKLIHNKRISSPISNQELNELYHIFSKLIVHKINSLTNGENND